MESIFGLIVFALIFIIGAAEKSSKKKKSDAIIKAERRMPSKGDDLLRQASATVKAMSSEVFDAIIPETDSEPVRSAEKPSEQLSLIEASLKEQASRDEIQGSLPMGDSLTDENGCIGGSLGAHSEEGESHAEHAEHIARRDSALAAEHSIAQDAAALRQANRNELRRAIVMAEILDKPVALRRR